MEQRYWTAVHTAVCGKGGMDRYVMQNTVDVTDIVSLRQAAILAGLLKAPSRYSPATAPELAEQRAAVVLEAMVDAGFLSEEEIAAAQNLPPLPRRRPAGSLHPITHTRRRLEAVFRQMGFDVVDGPHVEDEKYNFDDLNFQDEHPARDMQDTFFVDGRDEAARLVLRTHPSPVQIRAMLTRPPPVRLVAPGTVFRRDDDATHSPMFHQIEGLCIDRGVGMADLKATLYRFVRAFFGADLQVRLRPSFFPFVEPGAEFDMQCPFCGGEGCNMCKGAGWIELGGSGMVHPAVLEAVGVDPEVYTGWAFGFGIDRMALMLHTVPHLRLMFEGDVRFLEQFPC